METERGEKCNCAGITRFVLAILCKKQVGSQSKMLIKSQKKKEVTFIKWSFKSLWRWCKSKSNKETKIAFSPGHCHLQDNAVLQNKNWSTSRKPCWREEGPEKAREHRQSKRTWKTKSHMKQLLAESSSGDSFLGIVPFSLISPLLGGRWKIKLSHGVACGFGVILSPQGKWIPRASFSSREDSPMDAKKQGHYKRGDSSSTQDWASFSSIMINKCMCYIFRETLCRDTILSWSSPKFQHLRTTWLPSITIPRPERSA